jgi:uncharacterized membrane protein
MSPRSLDWRFAGVLMLVTAFGLLLRLYRLDRFGFWYDEGFSALMVELGDPAVWRLDDHPPLYYGVLWVWSHTGSSDVALRMLSVLCGVVTIPVVAALGAQLSSRTAGLWAALFLSILHIHVWYSREARMYGLMVLLFALGLLGLVRALDGARGGWVLYTVATGLLAVSHALGILHALVLMSLVWILAAPERSVRMGVWILASGIALLPFAAWFPFYITRAQQVVVNFWITHSSPLPPLFDTIRVFLGFGTDRLLVGAIPVLAALLVVLLGHRRSQRRPVVALILAYAAPMLILTLVSLLVRPLLIPRVLIPAVIPLVVLLGTLLDAWSPRRVWHHVAALVVALAMLIGTYVGWHSVAEPHHEWREASSYLQTVMSPADIVFFYVGRPRVGEPELAWRDLAARVTQLALDGALR